MATTSARKPDKMTEAIIHTIKAGMAEREWSAYTLAEESGVSVNHVYRILREQQNPSLDVVAKILRALDKKLAVVDAAPTKVHQAT